MKKTLAAIVALMMMFTVILLPKAQAATVIKIYIDGNQLATDQAPVTVSGRVFVPLRGIFEALDASVLWEPQTQLITANKGDTTVVLKIGAKTATINNQTVTLDAPARAMNGRTLVPIRFISESLGAAVDWNANSQSVLITSSTIKEVAPVQYVNVKADDQYGDGRDWQITFYPPSNQSNVNHYRVLVVKDNKSSSFSLNSALAVNSSNYTVVSPSNAGQLITLPANARDVEGSLLSTSESYRVFVLTAGNDGYALSNSSSVVNPSGGASSAAATKATINVVANNGDGRDLSVSFTKAQNDKDIASYRVIIVKTADASKFNLAAANALQSNYYNTVYKTNNSTLTTVFNSSSRDTSGDWIRNGVPYTAFVLSVSSKSDSSMNRLSAASPSVTLGLSSQLAPTITGLADVGNNGDGRDLMVYFNKAADESKVANYRIFVVRDADYTNFNLTEANKVSSSNYTEVSKTGNNISLTLSSNARDVKGNYISNGTAYRLFVMAVTTSNSSYPNALSTASGSITLTNGGANAPVISSVMDIADYNDGRDLQVSFSRSSDESRVNHYRIFVVKSSNADSFKVTTATAITNTNYYTRVSKTGGNITTILSSSARDVNGSIIKNGERYRVFVMAVHDNNNSNNNVLSTYSSEITLSDNTTSAAATNVRVSDVADNNNGLDLLVSFNRAADESQINHYRILVVKSGNASSFKLSNANAVSSNNYTTVYRRGDNISTVLAADARDVNGAAIRNGERYRVFVLSVRDGSLTGSNVLSTASAEITLQQNTTAGAPSKVKVESKSNSGDGSDLEVSFTRSDNESYVNDYRIILVPDNLTSSFGLNEAARAVSYGYTTTVYKQGTTLKQRLTSTTRDSEGNTLSRGNTTRYRAYVVAITSGGSVGSLSSPSDVFTLSTASAPEVSNVSASQIGQTASIAVNFNNNDENGIAHYAVLLVPEPAYGLTESAATDYYKQNNYTEVNKFARNITLNSASVDVNGAPIAYYVTYKVYVLSVADGAKATGNRLSSSVATVRLTEN